MRLSTCSILLTVSVSLLGLGPSDAEARQHYSRSVRSTRSYAGGTTRSYTGGVTRSYRGYHQGHYRSYGGAYRGYYSRGYRSFYRPHYRYGRYYGYQPYYRAYYQPSFYGGWGWPGWDYGAWPSVGFSVGYSPRVQVYSGGPTDYSSYTGAVRTQVDLKQTEVWLDGYYSGTVDDFDGSYQRLYMPPGEHEILLRLDGYRTYREVIQISPGRTFKLQHEMEPLGPGESTAPPPEDPERPLRGLLLRMTPTAKRALRHHGRHRAPASPPPPRHNNKFHRTRNRSRQGAPSRFGMLSLRVQPTDAQVYIDGELWGSLEGFEELSIHLPVGRHRIDIHGRGVESFETEVEIRTGEVTPLHVKLVGERGSRKRTQGLEDPRAQG